MSFHFSKGPVISENPLMGASPLKQIIDDLNTSIFPEETRLNSLSRACYEFDHRNKFQHDEEFNEGAANVLFAKLAFALAYKGTDEEVRLTCSALEMIHRGSPAAIENSYHDIGYEILPLFVKVLQRPFAESSKETLSELGDIRIVNKKMKEERERKSQAAANNASQDTKIAVQKVIKILAAYSLIDAAKLSLGTEPNMLPSLILVVDRLNGMTEAARYSGLAVLTNMAQAEENRVVMASEPGLINAIAKMCRPEESEMARQCSGLALMHLSYGNKEHVPLVDNEILLDALIDLMRDQNPEARKNACVALYNMACADENTPILAKHRKGMVIEALVLSLSNQTDEDNSRIISSETLYNMSLSEQEEVVQRIRDHPGLLMALASVLKFGDAPMKVQHHAADTILRLAHVTDHSTSSHEVLLTALVQASSWTRTSHIAEAFEVQASLPENRQIMVDHLGLLNALATQALTQGEGKEAEATRSAAISAIEQLTLVEENRQTMANNEGIMMALTRASFLDGVPEDIGDLEDVKDDDSPEYKKVQIALKTLVAFL
mmetsp:Transcript_48006/g.71148  ORF Transcript_48006/g.71148 Transcript_48006/m.71148 type:complete len:550 (-) Transcript_48006:317-1966(-)|eukprot:CAMPEP_0195509866 /NCGR_PEP_ID=MMETSP0794_2-20130614/2677_1 /TAXON_ID=515487 /ORGANISM="Stephanopyxis turris, Strain CCMP 815" /LENGTH=549 /DNA_ID=CAMNT_0040637177 /DNA_START=123 /DNA_END=1772 /DNA_ORIENTATION=-